MDNSTPQGSGSVSASDSGRGPSRPQQSPWASTSWPSSFLFSFFACNALSSKVTFKVPLSNKRLKLAGADRFKGSGVLPLAGRSEERRVGEESSAWGAAYER